MEKKLKQFGRILFFIILLELVLGGGGRFTAMGPVSLRMILFVIALLYTVIWVWYKKQINQYFKLVLLFSIVTAISTLVGFLSGSQLVLIFEDIKPLSFFLILPFFSIVINDYTLLQRISKLIISGACALAVIYLILVILINTGIIPFRDFYQLTRLTGELFYRGELAFFYKGFVYLCIGLIFITFQKPRHHSIMSGIIILAITIAFTRGFLFALLLTALTYQLFNYKDPLQIKIPKVAIICIGILIIVLKGNVLYASLSKAIYTSDLKPELTVEYKPENLLGDRNFSNNERKKQFNQVVHRITWSSAFIGHGFGIGVPVRPVHMEISYLEIFHKQGLMGLLFWGVVFLILTKLFLKAYKKDPVLACSFYFGCLFFFFQSLTNQYFNNPIGMSFILISMVSLNVILKGNE